MLVSWFSAGCSSFLAAYLVRDELDPNAGNVNTEIFPQCSFACLGV